MIYNRATAYSIRALTLLAMRGSSRPVLARDLWVGSELPRAFLGKLLQSLVRGGLLKSIRGRSGGFLLARPADKIFVSDIAMAIDGEYETPCCLVDGRPCEEANKCPSHDDWAVVRDEIRRFQKQTTLADMARGVAAKIAAREIVTGPQPVTVAGKPARTRKRGARGAPVA